MVRETEPSDDFGRDLKKLYAARSVPPDVEATILQVARDQMPARRPLSLRRFLLPIAAAAAIAMACLLWFDDRDQNAAPTVALASDVDGSGTVDILDAFILERRIAAGQAGERFDLDGDGLVNAEDVQRVARRAVQLR